MAETKYFSNVFFFLTAKAIMKIYQKKIIQKFIQKKGFSEQKIKK